MAEAPSPNRPSRGYFWRQMRAGDPVGKPLAEWAYTTPRFPGGLVMSDLRVASESIQRETALVWFTANFKPFELAPGPWLAFDTPGAGFDQGYWAPLLVGAIPVLREQFEGVLPPPVIESLGVALGDHWMWIEPDVTVEPTDGTTRSSASGLQAELDAVEDIIRSLVPEHGGIGHNAPDGEAPLTPEEQAAALAAIGRIRLGLIAEPLQADEVKAGALGLAKAWQTLGRYMLKQADIFMTETNKAVAQKVPHLIGATVIGWDRIGHLLTQLWQLLNHLPG